jgi:hypothetical protein
MKRIALALLLLCVAVPAMAASRSGAPAKFSIPFGSSAGSGFITYPLPTSSQIGITNCAASLTDGLPPKTMQPVSSGGCAPFGQDFNGIFKQITQWNQQTSMGAAPAWDSAFEAAISGYPEGAILSQSANPFCVWINQIDNNTSNPDSSGAGWTGACPGGGISLTSSGGGANAQTITSTPFNYTAGASLCWKPGFTNTGPLQINPNSNGFASVFQSTPQGFVALTGGEVVFGSTACAYFNGSNWQLTNSSANASLTQQDQTLSGGANVTAYPAGSFSGGATFTVDCGKGPLQTATNNGSFTIAAPSNDGSAIIKITNGSAAGTVTFSGFTVNANTGEPFTTTTGNIFFVTVVRIGGTSTYLVKAAQ